MFEITGAQIAKSRLRIYLNHLSCRHFSKIPLSISYLGESAKNLNSKSRRKDCSAPYLSVQWSAQPHNILLSRKPGASTRDAAFEVLTKLKSLAPNARVFADSTADLDGADLTVSRLPTERSEKLTFVKHNADLVIALGGDGTLLHVNSLFPDGPVPPVLPLARGSLGFLIAKNSTVFHRHLEMIMLEHRLIVLERMRLSYKVKSHSSNEEIETRGVALNEVMIHRGRIPYVAVLDLGVETHHFTRSVADGILISTPTGSTAYSLSAGGPIVHPTIPGLLLNPICPRSLSFRPLLLPSTSTIQVSLDESSRAVECEISADGSNSGILRKRETLQVEQCETGFLCAASPGSDEAWLDDLVDRLRFNQHFDAGPGRPW